MQIFDWLMQLQLVLTALWLGIIGFHFFDPEQFLITFTSLKVLFEKCLSLNLAIFFKLLKGRAVLRFSPVLSALILLMQID